MRAHVQVKGCTKAKPNSDGSISFSADVSNLRYLLNGPSPLYVLYVAQTGELRYVWVRDEVRRINTKKPEWMHQQTAALRFMAKLDEHGLEDIHERVRRDARITTQFHELLGRTDIRERTIHVDLTNATIIDTDAIREALVQGGLTLVSSGDPAKVLEAIDKLNYADKHLPRVLLVQAYARCSQGRYQTASGILMDLAPNAGALAETDRQFAALLRDICDHQLGRISTSEYIEKQKRAAQDVEEEFALSRRIDHLWYQLLDNGNRRGIELYLPPLRHAVARVLAMKDASEAFRMQARTAGLYGDGVELVERADHDIKILQLMRSVSPPPPGNSIFQALNAAFARWSAAANNLVHDAVRLGHPRLIGDACYVRSFILFVHYSTALLRLTPEGYTKHSYVLKAQVSLDVRRAIECYRIAGHVEWELHAKLLLADVSHLIGDIMCAAETATEVLPVAEAYQFDAMVSKARAHINGDPIYQQLRRKHLGRREEDSDFREAGYTDEYLRSRAADAIQALGFPGDVLPVFTRAVTSWRDVARERLHWCRHIQLLEVTYESDANNHVRDPLRKCHCDKLGLSSRILLTDWSPLISSFKQTHCLQCPDRSPKITPTSANQE
jgi:hypothetical protein